MGDVSFHLIDTNGFHTKTKNERFTAARSNLMLNWKKNFEKTFFLQRSLSRNDGNSSKSVLEYKNLHKRAYFAIFPPYSHPILFTMYPSNKFLNLKFGNYKSSFGKPRHRLYPRACCMPHVQHDYLSFIRPINDHYFPVSLLLIASHYLLTTAKYCHWKDLLLAKTRVRFVLSFRQLFLDYANSHLSSLTNSLPTNDTYHHVV